MVCLDYLAWSQPRLLHTAAGETSNYDSHVRALCVGFKGGTAM